MRVRRWFYSAGIPFMMSFALAMEIKSLKDCALSFICSYQGEDPQIRADRAMQLGYHESLRREGSQIPLDLDRELGYYHCLQNISVSWKLLAEESELYGEVGQPDGKAHNGSITGSLFIENGKKALTIGEDGKLCLWDIERMHLEKMIQAHGTRISSFAVSNDETLILTGSDDFKACVWRLPDLSLVREFLHPAQVTCVAISNSKNLFATGSTDGKVRIFTPDASCLMEYVHFEEAEKPLFMFIRAVRFTLDDCSVIAGADRVVKRWERKTGAVKTHGERTLATFPCSMLITQEGHVICGHATGDIEIIDQEGPPRKKRKIMSHAINAIALSHDGGFCVTGSLAPERRADLWICTSPFGSADEFGFEAVRTFFGSTGIKTAAINKDKSAILTGGHRNGILKLWSFRRLASIIGLKGAQLISALPSKVNGEGCIDLRPFPDAAEVFAGLHDEVKTSINRIYHVLYE